LKQQFPVCSLVAPKKKKKGGGLPLKKDRRHNFTKKKNPNTMNNKMNGR
jgi:hypothetical protein